MSIPSLSVKHPVLVNLLALLIVVGGIFSYLSMAQDRFPDVTTEIITVTTVLPGASPKEIEQLITIPLEEEIGNVDEVDEMTSTSAEGASTIVLALEPGLDVFRKVTEIQNEIQKVRDFPVEAEKPVVQEMKIHPETIQIALLGPAPEREVEVFAEALRDALLELPGVEKVDISGLREREIWIEIDPRRLHAYSLALNDVVSAVRRRNLNLPGGLIEMGRSEFTLRTEAEYKNLDDILETVVKRDGDGGYIYLRDLATVRDTYAERRTYERLDRQPSVKLSVGKNRGANSITVAHAALAKIEEMMPLAPAGTRMQVVEDSSVEIKNRLDALYMNFAVGLFFVGLTFTLFIGWRAGLMVGLGLPVALLGTFIFLNAYGFTVNLMTLFGLILVLGLVVDDAIVVCENVYRYVEQGMPIHEAAIKGTEEITWPVVATVLTSVSAFLPLLLMTGIMGQFMGVIPVVVTLALIASLFECLFVLPSHIAEWGGGRGERNGGRQRRRWLLWVTDLYEQAIASLLRWRYAVVASTVVLAAGAGYLAVNGMTFILFGGQDIEAFTISMEGPSGASLEETRRILGEIEDRAAGVRGPEVEFMTTSGGSISAGFASVGGTNLGGMRFKLTPEGDRERTGHEVREEIRATLADVSGARTITFEDDRRGPPVGKAIQVRIRGDNFATIKTIATQVKDYLRTIDGVTDVMDNFPPGKDEIRPEFDLDKLALVGLDVRTVATEVRGAFDGIEATRIHDADEEIDVIVKFDEDFRNGLANLEEMTFASPEGMIPFSNLGKVVRREGFNTISHYDGKRTINVLAGVDTNVITSNEANLMLMEQFADVGARYPGYSLSFGGEFEDTQESLNSLFMSFIIALILIYVILGALFRSYLLQPLVVMFAVPFSFIGVIFGFYIMGEPLGMFSLVGLIGLAGIVVNDSLILIDFINSRRRKGVTRRGSIVKAGAARLRPIILTSVTTIVGLLPMALGMFGVDRLLQPMALAIVWGLTFSTVLTLVIIPCVYCILDDYATYVLRCPLGLTRKEFRELKEKDTAAGEGAPAPPRTPEPGVA